MAHRKLRKSQIVYRIGDRDGRHPIFSGDGAALVEGRWHRTGQNVIYTAANYSTALLESLVHFNGVLPGDQHFVKIQLQKGTTYTVVTKDSLTNWTDETVSRPFGAKWFTTQQTALLFVPSFVAREELNVLINPNHPDAADVEVGLEQPVLWDDRLF